MRYQTLQKIKKKNADYNLIMSGRSTGKSTDMCRELKERYEQFGEKFVRVVRRLSYATAADSWFNDFSAGGKFSNSDDVIEFEHGQYLYNGEPFGELLILSLSSRYKSTVFSSDIKHFVFDEYIEVSPDEYLPNEIDKFKALLSTVFRGRNGKVWLLGNNLNEDSKYNPYHRYFGIDIDKDNIKQGQIKVYKSSKFKDPALIAFEYGLIAYEMQSEIPKLQRIEGNEVATSGEFAVVWNVFRQQEEYEKGTSFMRDSIDNFYIADERGTEYYAIVNNEKQSIDFIKNFENSKISEIGKFKDVEYYNKLVAYPDILIDEMGEKEYYQALEMFTPYEIATPLYEKCNRYGLNCKVFLNGVQSKYNGFTFRYADGNIKYIVENIIIGNKHE